MLEVRYYICNIDVQGCWYVLSPTKKETSYSDRRSWCSYILFTIIIGGILVLFIYRVSQEERSIFWEVIVSVILSKKPYMNMCPIPNVFRDRAIWLYSGLASAPSIVLPSHPATPLSEACESVCSVNFRTFIINCTNYVTWTINTGIRNSTYS